MKIGDFGLARQENSDIKGDTEYPRKWASPEVLEHTKFSIKSDVWSFGIMSYEVMTYGSVPYADQNNAQVVDYVVSGKTMEKSEEIEDDVWGFMKSLWRFEAEDRPSFSEVKKDIERLYHSHVSYLEPRDDIHKLVSSSTNSHVINVYDNVQ